MSDAEKMEFEAFLASLKPNLYEPKTEKEIREWEETQAEAANREFQDALVRSIPARHRWATLADPNLTARITRCDHSMEQLRTLAVEARQLLFHGPAGAGKTSAACAMIRERQRVSRAPALFIPAFRLATARIQHRAGEGEPPLVREAMAVPILLIDDVGQENHTANSAIGDVVQERHHRELVTWVTTGFSRDMLKDRYGAGFLRRVIEETRLIRFGAAA